MKIFTNDDKTYFLFRNTIHLGYIDYLSAYNFKILDDKSLILSDDLYHNSSHDQYPYHDKTVLILPKYHF